MNVVDFIDAMDDIDDTVVLNVPNVLDVIIGTDLVDVTDDNPVVT